MQALLLHPHVETVNSKSTTVIVSELPLLPSRQEVISRTSNAFHKSINKVNDNHNILKQYLERITKTLY